MKIDKFKCPESGDYIDPSGCHWEDAESFLQGYVLGFCCCGDPSSSLDLVRGALRLIDERSKAPDFFTHREDNKLWWEKHHEDEFKFFGNTQSRWFVYYFLASKNLTDHGGSVPGWLTEEGRDLLSDLEELAIEDGWDEDA
jgi:hypothetical protein